MRDPRPGPAPVPAAVLGIVVTAEPRRARETVCERCDVRFELPAVDADYQRADCGHAGAHYGDVEFEQGPDADGDEVAFMMLVLLLEDCVVQGRTCWVGGFVEADCFDQTEDADYRDAGESVSVYYHIER